MSAAGQSVWIVSGEEERGQVAERLSRLGTPVSDTLWLGCGAEIDSFLEEASRKPPSLLVVDSIQTMTLAEALYAPGSPALIRMVTARLLGFAKRTKTMVLVLGHVTKEGTLAGPKHLEHMVDVVLEMEKPRAEEFRTLRVAKNRFGPTNQIAVFRMQGGGLAEVADPSAAFLSAQWRERVSAEAGRAGLASAIAMDGGQPFLVQVEALVGARKMAPGRRAALGVARSRLELLIAVLEKTLGVDLGFTDVYVSLLGGITVRDTGVDLAILMALGSAALGFPVPTHCVFLGEVSLSGDVLSPKDLELRVRQAKSLGFSQVSHPQTGFLQLRDFFSSLRAAAPARPARTAALKGTAS